MKELELRPLRILIAVGCVGLLPALVVLFLLRLKDGQLVVVGQEVAEFDLLRLFAAQVSVLEPVLLILPLALGIQTTERRTFLMVALTAPVLLFGPGLLASIAVGGQNALPPITALGLYCLIHLNLCLWVSGLSWLTGFRFAMVIYAAVWAVSDYINYLRLYILPSLDIPWIKALGTLNWLLPQVKSGPSIIDDYLQSEILAWGDLSPTFVQIPLLLLLLFWATRLRKTDKANAT